MPEATIFWTGNSSIFMIIAHELAHSMYICARMDTSVYETSYSDYQSDHGRSLAGSNVRKLLYHVHGPKLLVRQMSGLPDRFRHL